MRTHATLLALALASLLGLAACGADDPRPTPGRLASLRIRNRSQFVLTGLRIHATLDPRASPELLDAPIPLEGEVLAYPRAGRYVTVLREAYARGPLRAFTTAEPLALASDAGYVLSVFDESFRLEGDAWSDPAASTARVVYSETSTSGPGGP
jgi:hypothetical protein